MAALLVKGGKKAAKQNGQRGPSKKKVGGSPSFSEPTAVEAIAEQTGISSQTAARRIKSAAKPKGAPNGSENASKNKSAGRRFNSEPTAVEEIAQQTGISCRQPVLHPGVASLDLDGREADRLHGRGGRRVRAGRVAGGAVLPGGRLSRVTALALGRTEKICQSARLVPFEHHCDASD